MPDPERVREMQRRIDSAKQMEETPKPLKAARSQAEITRTRQGWVLIVMNAVSIALIWLTRA